MIHTFTKRYHSHEPGYEEALATTFDFFEDRYGEFKMQFSSVPGNVVCKGIGPERQRMLTTWGGIKEMYRDDTGEELNKMARCFSKHWYHHFSPFVYSIHCAYMSSRQLTKNGMMIYTEEDWIDLVVGVRDEMDAIQLKLMVS